MPTPVNALPILAADSAELVKAVEQSDTAV